MYQGDALRTKQMLAFFSEATAERIKLLDAHAGKEVSKDELLRLPVGKEMQFHQHQERTVHQKNHQETAGSLGILDEFQQGIACCQCSVEIETVYFLLHFLFFFWITLIRYR